MSTFKGNWEKNGYEIRVFKEDNGGYQLEYSNDGFKTKQVKVYGSRYAFLKAMMLRFALYDLKDLLS